MMLHEADWKFIMRELRDKGHACRTERDLQDAVREANKAMGNLIHYMTGRSHELDDLVSLTVAMLRFKG